MNIVTTPLTLSHFNHQDVHTHDTMVLKAMAHSDRYCVLQMLAAEGEMNVSQINQRITLSQSALSQHLKVLRDAKLVQTRRAGNCIFYRFVKSEGAMLLASMTRLFG